MALSHCVRALSLLLVASLCLALCLPRASASRFHVRVSAPQQQTQTQKLPVFFFHGLTDNATMGDNLRENLTADGRVFHALTFCTNACSAGSLNDQVDLAIAQIRTIVTGANASTYASGYIFVGHSQGGALARAVVELMDDHNVRGLVSLAGAQNGIFYGPQAADTTPALAFAMRIGPSMIPPTLFNFSKYSPADFASGAFQVAFNSFVLDEHAELQGQVAVLGLARSPLSAPWVGSNPFLPRINNLASCTGWANASDAAPYDDGYSNSRSKKRQACEADQARRHANFLKLAQAHFFSSPDDGILAPWQSGLLGKYEDVASATELRERFRDLRVLNATQTPEYVNNTYGLRTLAERSDALFLHAVPGVSHSCWLKDSTPLGATTPCRFAPVYAQHMYPVFAQIDRAAAAACASKASRRRLRQ